MAAGGIVDGRGLAAALALGAAGASIGTRFYASAEALSTPEARQRVVAATGDQTCRTTVYDILTGYPWPSGHTNSVLGNEFTSRWHGDEHELRRHREGAVAEFDQADTDRNHAVANVTAGQANGLIASITPAADIVATVVEQATAALNLR